jgi:hypothetical protein
LVPRSYGLAPVATPVRPLRGRGGCHRLSAMPAPKLWVMTSLEAAAIAREHRLKPEPRTPYLGDLLSLGFLVWTFSRWASVSTLIRAAWLLASIFSLAAIRGLRASWAS